MALHPAEVFVSSDGPFDGGDGFLAALPNNLYVRVSMRWRKCGAILIKMSNFNVDWLGNDLRCPRLIAHMYEIIVRPEIMLVIHM